MSDIFRQALSNFTKNFAYGDAVRHLFRRGYTVDRILREFDYPCSREELERIRQEMDKGPMNRKGRKQRPL